MDYSMSTMFPLLSATFGGNSMLGNDGPSPCTELIPSEGFADLVHLLSCPSDQQESGPSTPTEFEGEQGTKKRKRCNSKSSDDDESRLSPTERSEKSRERNRQHARTSRKRKKAYIKMLEKSIVALKNENAALRDTLSSSQPLLVKASTVTLTPADPRGGSQHLRQILTRDFYVYRSAFSRAATGHEGGG